MSESANASLAGKVVTVLGGSGFFGRHLAQELLARGARLRIASRNPERAFRIKPLGNLGQVAFARVDVTRPETLAPALAGSDAVVNLVGAFSGDLDALQGSGAGRIAAAAKAAGANAFVHVSAIGGDAGSAVAYARTKAEGETAMRAAFAEATILRPSLLFGPDDNFVMMFARLIALFPVLPVFGPQVRLQPLFVDDAAAAAALALADPAAHGGKTYEIAGPEVISMVDLNRQIARAQGRKRSFIELPDAVSGGIAAATGWLPGAPITRDQWDLLKAGSVASGSLPGIRDFGIHPRPIELFLDRWMVSFRKHGRFGEATTAG
ncbi:complex I NDUFA9 subunit family protein [Novosphingobium album (ex Liu et al. 2023)]|uniref:Complex I NDUFA9 subunit family protein n=1 Tax=Novosphingobium album (ex Liu et al. 2023) TaxID=3031130 RepID=A0ABT5WR16_9SPHN|nr:complex I NDUFA9 subunit family protein [Novosphingobium album (ex Liu et al. 2023)]MDE8652490.1 complex I NDUFA9 subunit family protein [Novosphingobium album (ex Liu et al. 2023)]